MLEYFGRRKDDIQDYLKRYCQRKRKGFGRINALGPDLCDRLFEFTVQGKMIRGGLVSLSYSLFRSDEEDPSVRERLTGTGASMELIQSALLIHDDIMDRDPMRRGLSSIHRQYARMAEEREIGDGEHLGESLAICAGDVAFFLAFEILSNLAAEQATLIRILGLCSREIASVGVAQMQDVYNGASTGPVKTDDTLSLYVHKTGRYTFSMPLMIGSLLAGQPEETVGRLEELGEHIGIVFQIRDDELGLFGNPEETGKPVGSDIKEGKKTLFISCLLEMAGPEDRLNVSGFFGNPGIEDRDIHTVRDLVEKLGIREKVRGLTEERMKKAHRLLDSLAGVDGVDASRIAMLRELLHYSLTRSR
jgi:geranylgeranyl diphosphate synthase type I